MSSMVSESGGAGPAWSVNPRGWHSMGGVQSAIRGPVTHVTPEQKTGVLLIFLRDPWRPDHLFSGCALDL